MAVRAKKKFCRIDLLTLSACTNGIFTITAEIHAHSLANFYGQYADRHMNSKFMGHVSERASERNSTIYYRKKQIDVSF